MLFQPSLVGTSSNIYLLLRSCQKCEFSSTSLGCLSMLRLKFCLDNSGKWYLSDINPIILLVGKFRSGEVNQSIIKVSDNVLESGFLNLGSGFFLPLSSSLSRLFWRESECMLCCLSEMLYQEHKFGRQLFWVRIPALPLITYVAISKVFSFSKTIYKLG